MSNKIFMLITLFAIALFAVVSPAQAQDSTNTGWKKTLILNLNVTQIAYSDSWVGGENGSASWVANSNGTAEKAFGDFLDLKSTLKLSFGQTLVQDTSGNWSKPRISTDLIDWENVMRFTLNKYVDPFIAVRLESRFADASFGPKKRYLNPMILTETAGISRKFFEKDKNLISSRLGLAVRQIFKDAIIINPDSTWETTDSNLTDGGIESVTDISLTLDENILLTSKLILYKAFWFSKKNEVAGTESEDYWKAVDLNWENIINATVTKIISVNIYTQLLYDKEISKSGRFKQSLGLGLQFKVW